MVDQGDKCLNRTTFTSLESCRSDLYRRLKRRLGCSFRRRHSKRRLVSSRKSSSHKFPGTKSGPTGLEKVPVTGTRQSSSSGHRQHHGCGIHQQGRRYEVRLTLCPSMVTPMLVQSETGSPTGQAHTWASECNCRQIVSSRPSHSDRMVPSPGGLRPPDSDLAPSPGRHVCNEVQLQTGPVCVSSTGPQGLGSGRPDSLLGKPGHVYLSPSILQQGEWVTSLDFSDAYFHIPVHVKSRKYLRFHFQGQSYQFRALPFGLSTAPMEFTCVVKEVKLMAQSRGIRIHQYLDDWLIRAPTKESCHQGTQSLLALCQELGWIINVQKSELEPKQIFEFVGYKYDLSQGLVLPTQSRWESILQKLGAILSKPSCRVRNFMSLIGLLTATEKKRFP